MLTFCDNPRTEVIQGMSWEDYRALPALSQSLIKLHDPDYEDPSGSCGCPALFKWRWNNPDNSDTPARSQGRAFHCLILEPSEFHKRYRFLTAETKEEIFQQAKDDGAISKSKAAFMKHGSFKEWETDNGAKGFGVTAAYQKWLRSDEREVISTDFYNSLSGMVEAIKDNPDVAEELQGVKMEDCEVTVLAPHKFRDGSMVQLKCRLDLMSQLAATIDAKTCRSTNPRKFGLAAAKYGYDLQSAVYMDVARTAGLNFKRFGFLAQEKTAPFVNCIHWMPDEWIRYARIRYRKILSDIAENIQRNTWPNPDTGMLEPPSYLQAEIEAIAA